MIFYVILGLSSFLISLIGTRLTILALRKRIHPLDIHRARKENQHPPAPHGGGIAVFFAMIICLLVADMHYPIILSLFLLAAISLLGELMPIPGFIKLLVQIISVSIALTLNHMLVFGGAIPPLADKVITGLAWIWCINLFKGMDKLEGLSATEMIAIGFGVCLITGFFGFFPHRLFSYGMIVATAGAGFLWWNAYPAKIWLGEVGTTTIGFIVFYLLLQLIAHDYYFAAAILPGYYLADGIISGLAHIRQHKTLNMTRCEFYYQAALQSGKKPDEVIQYIFGVNLLLVLLAVRSALEPDIAIIYLSVAYMVVFMLLGFFAYPEAKRTQGV